MIADLLPLLALAALVTIARNIYEAYVLERAERRSSQTSVPAPAITGVGAGSSGNNEGFH
jgi:hypothetical protein